METLKATLREFQINFCARSFFSSIHIMQRDCGCTMPTGGNERSRIAQGDLPSNNLLLEVQKKTNQRIARNMIFSIVYNKKLMSVGKDKSLLDLTEANQRVSKS